MERKNFDLLISKIKKFKGYSLTLNFTYENSFINLKNFKKLNQKLDFNKNENSFNKSHIFRKLIKDNILIKSDLTEYEITFLKSNYLGYNDKNLSNMKVYRIKTNLSILLKRYLSKYSTKIKTYSNMVKEYHKIKILNINLKKRFIRKFQNFIFSNFANLLYNFKDRKKLFSVFPYLEKDYYDYLNSICKFKTAM